MELAPRLRPWLRAYLSNPRNRLPQNQLDALLDAQLEDPVRYAVLLALAAGIATYGLIGDSSPVIIGAMIVSPLMSPILGLAYDDVLPLVPPLCVTGIGLAGLMDVVNHGNFLLSDLSWPVTSGSFLLFFTNLFGITVAAALVLRLYGYGRRTAMGRLFACLSLLLAAVVIPLWLNDASVFLQARVQKSLHVIERLYPAMEIKTVIAQPKHQPPQVEFVLGVPRQPTIDERRDMLRLVESILGRRVQASFSFVSRASS